MGGSTKQKTQSTQTRTPFSPAVPQLSEIPGLAQGLYQQRLDHPFFPGQTYAGFGNESEAALTGIANRAQSGSPLVRGAQSMLTDTVGGSYLNNGNPFSGMVAQRTMADVMPAINSTFGRAGRTGSDAHAYSFTRGLGDAIAPIYSAQYENERGRQMQAAGMAPTLANQDYYDLAQLRSVGQERDAMAQRGIDEAMLRYNYPLDNQSRALQEYLSTVGAVGSMGGTQEGTSTTSQKQNPLQTALGLGMMGASLFTGGNPFSSLMGGGGYTVPGGGWVGTGGQAPYGSLPWQNPYYYQPNAFTGVGPGA